MHSRKATPAVVMGRGSGGDSPGSPENPGGLGRGVENGDVKDEWSGPDEGVPEEGVPGRGVLHKGWKVRQEKSCLLTKTLQFKDKAS